MRTILLSAFAFGVLSIASCAKDYSCTCVVDAGGTPTTGKVTIHDTKKKAEEACSAGNDTYTSSNITITTTCTLD
jgi:hypothetical protein